MKPRSINIFLLDGDPNGIRVAQISMSTIQAIAFRRNQFRKVREAFPEIERPGVYILIGADEEADESQIAYIGESEEVGARLQYHNSNKAGGDNKEFWTDTVVLISKDENLTKSHARYVEACLISAVGSNPRWTLPNSKTPSHDAGKLPLPDKAAMDEFVDQTKTLGGALGWDLFREIRGRVPEKTFGHGVPEADIYESPRFYFRSMRDKSFDAELEIGLSGDFVVTAGSRAKVGTAPSVSRGVTKLRKTLAKKGILQEEEGFLVFTSAYSFTSTTAAAAVVSGANVNGRTSWKLLPDSDGRTYADWENFQGVSDVVSP